jgi:hypothetical protein
MKRVQPALDQRPGALPDVRTCGSDITFVMAPAGTPASDRLIIRCDDHGGVWISIGSTRPHTR